MNPNDTTAQLQAQQQEALKFFHTRAGDWKDMVRGDLSTRVNVQKQRNDVVLHVAAARRPGRTLDVGCGSGELVVELARAGHQARGIDFAPDMIAAAQDLAKSEAVQADFVCASAFDDLAAGATYDLISANGFIEYITPEQLKEFLRLVRGALAPGGSFVVGSRNRLFNAFSCNRFTELELELGTISSLLREAMAIAGAASPAETVACIEAMRANLPQLAAHPQTGGIEVTVRHQYTPAELLALVREAGMHGVELIAVHCHPAPPQFASQTPEAHATLANALQTYAPTAPALIPFASSFMLHAQ